MARRSPNGRPLVGQRLNSTAAIVQKGICPPLGVFERCPSPEAMVTDVSRGGARPTDECRDSAPDRGNTLARARDYLRTIR